MSKGLLFKTVPVPRKNKGHTKTKELNTMKHLGHNANRPVKGLELTPTRRVLAKAQNGEWIATRIGQKLSSQMADWSDDSFNFLEEMEGFESEFHRGASFTFKKPIRVYPEYVPVWRFVPSEEQRQFNIQIQELILEALKADNSDMVQQLLAEVTG